MRGAVDLAYLFFLLFPTTLMSTPPPRLVVVDDTDGSIEYTGPWLLDNKSKDAAGNFGPPYLHTLHSTKDSAALTFSFNGSSLFVTGSINIRNDSGVVTPAYKCFVDLIQIPNGDQFQFFENNWNLCSQDDLVDGPHVLTINVTTAGQEFLFDSIQYKPSPGAPLYDKVIKLNHMDPDIQYGAGWGPLGSTANMTGHTGSEVSLNFIGNSVQWLGFIPTELSHNASSATFSIDGGIPVNFQLQGLPPDPKIATQYNQVFFQTPDNVPQGNHTLKVVYLGTSQTPLTVTHMYITNGSAPDSSSTPPPPNPGSTSPDTTHPGTKSKTPIGAIVGGVVGGLVALILVAVLLWLYKRRSRRSTDQSQTISVNGNGLPAGSQSHHRHMEHLATAEPLITPFTLHQQNESSANANHGSSAPQSVSAPSAATATAASSSSGIVPYGRPSYDTTNSGSVPSHGLRHQDSGQRIPQPVEEDIMEELPPSYTPGENSNVVAPVGPRKS